MARKPSGHHMLQKAKELLANARTVKEIRQAQAVIMPIELNISLKQTAETLGISKNWVCHLRTEFIHADGNIPPKNSHGGRRRENLSLTEETLFLEQFIEKARAGGILVANEIKDALELQLGRKVALASVYNLLHRHNWRKIVPDKRHPKSNPETQEEFRKNLPELISNIKKEWLGEEPMRLMFQDEARFGRISDIRRSWCPRPYRQMCHAMITHEYSYVYAAASVADGTLDSLILPHVNTECMQLFLNEVAARHPKERIIMITDGAGWHKTTSLAIPANMRLLKLPPYSPELNPVEQIWDELREKSFHNRTFESIDVLEDHLCESLRLMENDKQRVHSIVAWPWIINSLSN